MYVDEKLMSHTNSHELQKYSKVQISRSDQEKVLIFGFSFGDSKNDTEKRVTKNFVIPKLWRFVSKRGSRFKIVHVHKFSFMAYFPCN